MTGRARLANRRMHYATDLEFEGQAYTLGVGADEASGRAKEIFISATRKYGSGTARLADDTSIALSIGLQHGVPLAAFVASVGRLPEGDGKSPASLIGAAVDKAAELTGELREITPEGGN